jgi:hypothetical protein
MLVRSLQLYINIYRFNEVSHLNSFITSIYGVKCGQSFQLDETAKSKAFVEYNKGALGYCLQTVKICSDVLGMVSRFSFVRAVLSSLHEI